MKSHLLLIASGVALATASCASLISFPDVSPLTDDAGPTLDAAVPDAGDAGPKPVVDSGADTTAVDSGDSGQVTGHDSGTDAGIDAGYDAGPPDTGPPDTGPPPWDGTPVLLQQASYPQVLGVTSDDQVIYLDQAQPTGLGDAASVSPVAATSIIPGGNKVTIVPASAAGGYPMIVGPDVLYWTNPDDAGQSSLFVWTAASGLPAQLLTATAQPEAYDTSADGTKVFFAANSTATSRDLCVANNDGTGIETLVAHVSAVNCTGYWSWGGTSLIANYCLAPTDAGAADASPVQLPTTLAMFTVFDGGPPQVLATLPPGTPEWQTDGNGDTVFAVTAAGVSETYNTTTGAVGPPLPTGISNAYFLGDGGSTLLYQSGSGIAVVQTASPDPPLVLVDGGVAAVQTVSLSGQTVAYSDTEDPDAGNDLYIVATNGGSAPVTVLQWPVVDSNWWTSFTTDSNYILYATASNVPQSGTATATLAAMAVASPGWSPSWYQTTLGNAVSNFGLAANSKVVFCANTDTTPVCNLSYVDLSQGSPPNAIVISPNVNPQSYLLSASGRRLLYNVMSVSTYQCTISFVDLTAATPQSVPIATSAYCYPGSINYAFSSDESRVVFSTNNAIYPGLYVVTLP